MAEKKALQITVSGYISEVTCGAVPVSFKEAFANYLIETRDKSTIPEWLLKGSPDYVGSEQIEQIWYFEEKVMGELMKRCGRQWGTYKDVNDLYSLIGFGSGKEGVGIFEIGIIQDGRTVREFVPFEPAPNSPDHLRDMDGLFVRRLEPPPLPCPDAGDVAVSAGAWTKGVLRYNVPSTDKFRTDRLELLIIDLTDLGVGEDYFVAGLRYEGKDLTGEVVKTGKKEMYPVSWYSPQKRRWLRMHERV